MPARIVRLRSDTSSEADGLPERARKAIIDTDHRQAAVNGLWTFVMLSPEQNAAVARWLGKNSGRPKVALLLWQELFTALERETGEITLTRYELAERVGTSADEVSRIMGELARFGAITVHREKIAGLRGPGRAVYRMNPNVATNLAGAARDRAQARAPKLRLVDPPERLVGRDPRPAPPRLTPTRDYAS